MTASAFDVLIEAEIAQLAAFRSADSGPRGQLSVHRCSIEDWSG
jgi:hypothetical protein